MRDPFEHEALPAESKETWHALDHLPSTTVSDRFEARLMARIENLESLETEPKSGLLPRWLQSLDGLFDFLHVPALALLIALFFWLPTSAPQTAHRLDFPVFENPRVMQDREAHVLEPQKILQLLIHISRS